MKWNEKIENSMYITYFLVHQAFPQHEQKRGEDQDSIAAEAFLIYYIV